MSARSNAESEAENGPGWDVVPLMEPLRRYALSRTGDLHDADDIVQETLARVLATRRSLEPSSLLAYAIVIARNLLASDARATHRARRMAPKVVDLRQPDRPDDTVVDREERAALTEALAALPPDQREPLVAHAVHDVPVTSLATSAGTSPAALAAQMARTRARLRVDYLVALRREQLPTARCRPVLLAMSLGDRRRQEALRAGSHLLICSVCADLSEPLLERKRALAGLLPWLPAGALVEWLRGAASRPAVQAGSVLAAVVTATVLVANPWGGSTSPAPAVPAAAAAAASQAPAAAGTGTSIARGAPPAAGVPAVPSEFESGPTPDVAAPGPGAPDSATSAEVGVCSTGEPSAALASFSAARTARCEGGLVLDVPADEGFWVQSARGARVWVQLTGSGESAARVRPGQRVSFVGSVVSHGDDFPSRVGVEPDDGSATLRRQGAHVELAAAELAIVATTP